MNIVYGASNSRLNERVLDLLDIFYLLVFCDLLDILVFLDLVDFLFSGLLVRVAIKIKGVDKKPNLAAYFPQSVAVSGERSSEKNNLSKIEKTGGQSQRAEGCFFNF